MGHGMMMMHANFLAEHKTTFRYLHEARVACGRGAPLISSRSEARRSTLHAAMLTDSAADHLARVRLAAGSDEMRRRLVEEMTARVGESDARKRAELAAEELAAIVAQSEESARSAAESTEAIERRLVEEQKCHSATRDAMTRELGIAHRALAEAEEQRSSAEGQLQSLRLDIGHRVLSAVTCARFNTRAKRRALQPWWHWACRARAQRTISARHRRRVAMEGFCALRSSRNQKELDGVVYKAGAAIRMRGKRLGFTTWASLAASRIAMLAQLSRSFAAFRNQSIRTGFSTWAANAHATAAQNQGASAAVRRWRAGSLSRAFLAMRNDFAMHSRKLGFLNSLILRKVHLAYNQWHHAAIELSESSTQIQGALQGFHPLMRKVRQAFNTFEAAASSMRRLRHATAGVLHSSKLLCLNTWLEFIEANSQQMAVLRRGGAALRQQGLRRAWMSFIEEAAEAAERMNRLRSAGAEWRGSGLRAAWLFLSDNASHMAIMKGVMTSLRLRHLRRSLNHWGGMASELKELQMQARQRMRSMDPATRKMRQAYNTLKEGGDAWRRLRRAATALMQTHKLRTLNTWRMLGKSSSGQMAALRRAATALRHKGLLRSFASWDAIASAAVKAKRQLRGAVTSMRSQKQRSAYNTWSEVASERKGMLQRSAQTLLNPATRKMRQAYNTLKAAGINWRRLRRAAAGLMNSRKLRAYNVWAELPSLQRERSQHVFSKAIAAFSRRHIRMAYNTWFALADDAAKRKRSLLHSAAAGWRNNSMRKAWLSMVDLMMQRRLMAGVVRSLKYRNVRLAYNAWASAAAERAQGQQKARAALRNFDPVWRAARQVMQVWRSDCEQIRHLRMCVRRLMGQSMSRALGAWVDYAHEHAMENVRRLAMLNRAAGALQHRGVLACFNTWQDVVSQRAERQRRLEATVKDFLHGGGYRKAWFAWLQLVDELNWLRSKLVAFRNPGLLKAFACWTEKATDMAERRRRLAATTKDLLHGGGYRKAWMQWSELAAGFRRARGVVRGLMNSKLFAALNSWRSSTVSQREVALRMLQATREAARWSGERGMEHAFFMWRSLQMRKRLESLIPVRTPLLLKPAFDTWAGRTDRRSSAAMTLLGARHAFNVWLEAALELGESRSRRRHLNQLRRGDRTIVCHRGQWMLRQLRHAGLRGVGSVWRHSLLSGRPRFSRAWIMWKSAATRSAVARSANARRVRLELSRGLLALRNCAFLQKLRDRLEAVQSGRRARLKVCKVELMSAEAHSTLLAEALDKVSAKNKNTLRRFEEERDAALASEQKAKAAQEAEHAAALAALARRAAARPKSPARPKTPASFRVDRWSTAASRGHSQIPPDQFNATIERQRMSATNPAMGTIASWLASATHQAAQAFDMNSGSPSLANEPTILSPGVIASAPEIDVSAGSYAPVTALAARTPRNRSSSAARTRTPSKPQAEASQKSVADTPPYMRVWFGRQSLAEANLD